MAITADSLDDSRPPGMSPGQVFQFYVLMPLTLGLFLGMGRIGSQQFQSVGYHMAYTTLHFMLSWMCWGLGTKLTSWALRPWRPSLLFVLVVGNYVGGFGFWWPLREVLNTPFVPYLLPGSHFPRFWPPEHWGSYSVYTIQGTMWWLLANWVDFRYRRVARFGFLPLPAAVLPVSAPPGPLPPEESPGLPPPVLTPSAAEPVASVPGSAPADPDAPPRLQLRLPAHLRDARIHALEAEEHYTKIYTNKGSTLLLIRFSDAITDMTPQPGLQVHRSFWVSRHAVDRVVRVDRRWVVRTLDGLEIPVSRSYRVLIQAAGLVGGAAMRDD